MCSDLACAAIADEKRLGISDSGDTGDSVLYRVRVAQIYWISYSHNANSRVFDNGEILGFNEDHILIYGHNDLAVFSFYCTDTS